MTEPTPWPRAQPMPIALVGGRAEPWHHQAVAEYDAAHGTVTEPNSMIPGCYTAAQINRAIGWWNLRVANLTTDSSGHQRTPGDSTAQQSIADFLRSRLGEDEATARSAMTYTTGEWDLMTKCWVDMHTLDVQVDGGGVIKGDGWDSVFMTGSDRFVAEHIVRFRPVDVLLDVQAKIAVVGQYEAAVVAAAQATDTETGWIADAVLDALNTVLRALASAYSAHPDFDPAWSFEPEGER